MSLCECLHRSLREGAISCDHVFEVSGYLPSPLGYRAAGQRRVEEAMEQAK